MIKADEETFPGSTWNKVGNADCLSCTHFSIDVDKLPLNYHNSDEPQDVAGACLGFKTRRPTTAHAVCSRHDYKGVGDSPTVQLSMFH